MHLPSFTWPSLITWTPFYLTFILFLQALCPDETLANGGRTFGESCSINTDCKDTKYCSKISMKCDCPNYESKKLVQFYDEKTHQCLSVVDKGCTLKKDRTGFLSFFRCVPNAICVTPDYSTMALPRNIGVCKCDVDFVVDRDQLCVPENYESVESKDIPFGIGEELLDKVEAAKSKDDLDRPNQGINVDRNALQASYENGGGIQVTTSIVPFAVCLLVGTWAIF